MTKPGNDELLFLALGGSGEIGMNVNLYGTAGKWLMVDCGITFADAHYPGVDIVLPDLGFIEDQPGALAGIVLTHGHEDHIGALPYFAADLNVPLYATRFTAGLIRAKLEEEGIANRVKLRVIEPGDRFDVGPFGITYVPLAHSIAEANALLIETPHGRIFHTGDWKLDPAPQIGTPASGEELTKIGDAGVLALVCDSTNVFNPKPSGSEADAYDGLKQVISAAEGRVVVTSFASNVARLHSLGRIAEATGRRLSVAGRSLDRIIRVAQACGYLKDLPPLIDPDSAMRLPPREVLFVATGGQGEPRAALARIASEQHSIRLSAGDTVIFSTRVIPGNESAIGRIENALAAKGVRIVTDRQEPVHVSGHPGRPELASMYRWIRPEIVIPVHGEARHLAEQGRFAISEGLSQAIVQANGSVIRLAPGAPKLIDHATVGRLVLDGDVILPADGGTINERRKLAANGLVTVAAALGRGRNLQGEPQILVQGMPVEEDHDEFVAETADIVRRAIARGDRNAERLGDAIRVAVRRHATDWTGKKPVVLVSLIEI